MIAAPPCRWSPLESDLSLVVTVKGLAVPWQPLSVREGLRKPDEPFENVGQHLKQPLMQWLEMVLGARSSDPDVLLAAQVAAAARAKVGSPGQTDHSTVKLTVLSIAGSGKLLDGVDAYLAMAQPYGDMLWQLEKILSYGGSAWTVSGVKRGLERRVDRTATVARDEAMAPGDLAAAELGQAWSAAYGRAPNGSDAWDHSIKAVEHLLVPLVLEKDKGTLGQVVAELRDHGNQWRLQLEHGKDDSDDVVPLLGMLQLLWVNPDRHGGTHYREPSLLEAQAMVHLAVTIVQWSRSGVLSKRP